MVVLGGGLILMSEVPLCRPPPEAFFCLYCDLSYLEKMRKRGVERINFFIRWTSRRSASCRLHSRSLSTTVILRCVPVHSVFVLLI